MIKEDKPLFHPTFGSRPAEIVGRDEILRDFLDGLDQPVGSRERCRFYVGQRGMGKTVLLLEMERLAWEKEFIPVRVTAHDGMNEDIINLIQVKGAEFVKEDKKTIKGASGGFMGFSFGLTFSDEAKEQYGFRTKLTMLCEELNKNGKGVLILIDEAKTSDAMRRFASTYQSLVGDEMNIAVVIVGLPQSISSVLNDDVLTFLNRATQIQLAPIRTSAIVEYYDKAFRQLEIDISGKGIDEAAYAVKGFPYMMQLVGHHISKSKEFVELNEDEAVGDAIDRARADLAEDVYTPVLTPLSDNDRKFLYAMAEDDGESSISDICSRLGKSNSYVQPYRARLIEAGIIESPRKGKLVFTVPYIGEYLRDNPDRW